MASTSWSTVRCRTRPSPLNWATRSTQNPSSTTSLPNCGSVALRTSSKPLPQCRNIRFPLSFLFFRVSLQFFAMACKFCNAWRPKQSNFYNALFKLHFAWQNELRQCSFFRVIAFFALRTEKLDVQEEVFAIAKQVLLFLHSFEFVNYQCNFDSGIAIFTLLRKTVFCSVKIAMLWLFFGCILEPCNFYS